MKQLFSILLLTSSAFLVAQNDQQMKQQMNERALSAGVNSLATNLRSDTVDILNYNISLNITDFTTNVIAGNTKVKFTPKMNGVNKLNLDFLELIIDSIEIGGSNLTYSYNDTLLSVNLPVTYNVNDTATVQVYYHGTPQGDPSGWGGFYFQSGYAYNLGVGFGALPHTYGRVWFPCFDNFVERSSYEFNITTNAGKVAYCNGYLANDSTDGGGLRTRRWILNEQIPTYLASVSVAAYAEVNQTYNGIAGVKPIILAAVASDTTAVKNSFINLPVALATYENHFGPYMWNRVGYCMVPFNSGAMEHATNISYPKATATGSITYQTLYAHELSHHWFGDLATCRTAEDMWLNEGWAHYCEFLFSEALYGYTSYMASVRVNHEDNLHFNTPKEGVQTLSNIPQSITYGDHVYNKGADVAHTMRSYLGDSLFFYSVRTYLAQNNYKDVSSVDFMNALTAASGVDMSDFFNDWVFNPGWPHFSIDSTVVVPSGPNYDVTVYVKQKLTDAPNYYTNVPLEMTFKDAAFNEQIQPFVMSGANASFTFTVPFDPAFVALNVGEKISHAVAADSRVLKTLVSTSFPYGRTTITPLSIVDSAFIRVEHNFTAPDPFKTPKPYRISPNRYWKFDGILPSVFKAKATLVYDGRTTSFTGNFWLDNQLNITVEDSVFVLYRANTADDWHLYPYQTRNIQGSNTDRRGLITLDTMMLGEYAMAVSDYSALGIQTQVSAEAGIKVYPNPSKTVLTIDLADVKKQLISDADILVTDVAGRVVANEKLNAQQDFLRLNTGAYDNGVYFIAVRTKNKVIARNKFIVSH